MREQKSQMHRGRAQMCKFSSTYPLCLRENKRAAIESRGSKEIAFAEMVQEKNQDRKQEYHICLFVYLLWILVINLFLDYQLQDAGDRMAGIVMLIGMALWISLFSEQYFKCYFTLLGEHGEQEQNIMAVVRQFPFSLAAYGSYIRKRLRFWQRGIFCGTMLLSVLGMLIFTRHDTYPVFLWETQDSGKTLLLRGMGIMLVSFLMAMLPSWILQIKLVIARRYQENDGKSVRKTGRENPRKMMQEKKWLLICLEIFLLISLSALFLIIEEWIHPVSRDGILFIHTLDLWIFAIIIFVDSVRALYQYLLNRAGETLQYQEKIRQRRKIVIPFCIALVVFILPQFYYETFYEDRMESSFFFQTRSYEWQDVVSYEVYCPGFGTDIQLRLSMKDGSKKRVLWNHTNYSEKYYSDYGSDYIYIEKMVEKLEALGAEGSLKDSAKISRKVSRGQVDVDDREAWKHIRKMMQKKSK